MATFTEPPNWEAQIRTVSSTKITSSGKITVIYNFDGSTHGGLPVSPLVQGNDGSFYGTTLSYGTGNGGVIFKISRPSYRTS